MKSAIVEREVKDFEKEKDILIKGLKKFPEFPKLWLMLAQNEERKGDIIAARSVYKCALIRCHESVTLWMCCLFFLHL